MSNKKKLSLKEKLFLEKVIDKADARRSYRRGISIFEQFKKRRLFDEQFNYYLGTLYDHFVIFQLPRLKNKKWRRELASKYIERAEEIYRKILESNKNSIYALRGLARISEIKKDSKSATKYALRAYRRMLMLPKNKRWPLAIGSSFETSKDYKKAEQWYKKELKMLGENNLGAIANLMMFYARRNEFKKGFSYVQKTEKLLMQHLNLTSPDKLKKLKKKNKTVKHILVLAEKIRNKTKKAEKDLPPSKKISSR